MQQIKFLGKEIKIAFNVAVQIEYENITGEPFDVAKLAYMKNSVALYEAAIKVSNPDAGITSKDIIENASSEDMNFISTAVVDELTAWINVPDLINEEPAKEGEEKNS
jgi:hypothetical protein